MIWQIINLEQTPSSPWKNGGGVTRELVAWPRNSNWDWRMSVAEVASDGAFSRFEGVQRWFAVLNGNGVQLQMDEAVHVLTVSSEPFSFDGAAAVDCKLLSGATQDFNLMTRCNKAKAAMYRLSDHVHLTINDSKIIAIYAINTLAEVEYDHEKITIKPNALAWCAAPAGTRLAVNTTNALLMEITECT